MTALDRSFDEVLPLLLLAALMLLPLLVLKPRPSEEKKVEKTVTVLRCYDCGYQVEREFRKGDYVGKLVGKCPRCGAPLYVHAIYVKLEEKRKRGSHGART